MSKDARLILHTYLDHIGGMLSKQGHFCSKNHTLMKCTNAWKLEI